MEVTPTRTQFTRESRRKKLINLQVWAIFVFFLKSETEKYNYLVLVSSLFHFSVISVTIFLLNMNTLQKGAKNISIEYRKMFNYY